MAFNKNIDDMWDMGNAQISIQESGESIEQNNKGFFISADNFGPLADYVKDENITDIDFNGTDLWITDIKNKHWKDEGRVDAKFIRKLAQDIANSASKEFNQKRPNLEAETDDLRISILHNSVAQTGTTMCIRKTPRMNRINEKYAIESTLADFRMQSLIANCVKAHMNFVICGEPRAGKTEFAKYVSSFIPTGERVITIEDVMEWRYKSLHPDADVIEMKVNKDFDYSAGIVASLKQNPKWLMIAETRGKEVKNLIQSFSTGVNGITTLHTDDIAKIPSRIVNMADDSITSNRMEQNAYEFIDVGIYISMFPDKDGGAIRRVNQLGFFASKDDEGENKCYKLFEGGELFRKTIPSSIQEKFKRAGIEDIFFNQEVYDRLKSQGYNVNLIDRDKSLSDEYMKAHTLKDVINEDVKKAEMLKHRQEETESVSFGFDADNTATNSFDNNTSDLNSSFVNSAVYNNFNNEDNNSDYNTSIDYSQNYNNEQNSESVTNNNYNIYNDNDNDNYNNHFTDNGSQQNNTNTFTEEDEDDWFNS